MNLENPTKATFETKLKRKHDEKKKSNKKTQRKLHPGACIEFNFNNFKLAFFINIKSEGPQLSKWKNSVFQEMLIVILLCNWFPDHISKGYQKYKDQLYLFHLMINR